MNAPAKVEHDRRNRKVATRAALFMFFMLGVAFASVPLYRAFCQATGFGGTPRRAEVAPGAVAGQISVRFDSNINAALPWEFRPEQTVVKIHPGEKTQISYFAHNMSARVTTGRAVFNVSPDLAGQYFSKIACFCFTEQTLRPGQKAHMPVVFFVDPQIRKDPATKDIHEITLSYTFYPVEKPGSAS
ncbi:cytochrome c oxidase assembly protein [Sphingomonas sp. KRR8]|uniref:cytochrome c oxidase assembly protein n=1 Tax=Sphingomonas sp. KRR8 TaxID=2942996 RepID=UPI002020EF50|nr:cytochrome c oxidase assembly protein [Sphingomonas sp. KRR8]URD60344.1 cytochrome c oxidase assembly protein [Sphingomonas sp. KRR8]